MKGIMIIHKNTLKCQLHTNKFYRKINKNFKIQDKKVLTAIQKVQVIN